MSVAIGDSLNVEINDRLNVGSPFQTTASQETIEAGMKALAEGLRQRYPDAVIELGGPKPVASP